MTNIHNCMNDFFTPVIHDGENEIKILNFECPIKHHAFSAYYSQSDGISVDMLSEIMSSALLSCFHCIQSKLDGRNGDNE